MASGIVAWRGAVADRLDAAIPVHADRTAAPTALERHDIRGPDSIQVEPCTTGCRLVRRPCAGSLLPLHA